MSNRARRRVRTKISVVAVVLLPCIGSIAHSQTPAAAAETRDGICRLHLDLPAGATFSVDGQDYGSRRLLEWPSLEPETSYVIHVVVTFSDGSREERDVVIEAGREIRLALTGLSKNRPELALQTGHRHIVTSLAWSPNGQYMATGSGDRSAILWDAASGRQLRRYLGHQDVVTTIAFSSNGEWLLTGAKNKLIVWHVASGRQMHVLQAPHELLKRRPDYRQDGLAGSVLYHYSEGRDGREVSAMLGISSAAISDDGSRVVAVWKDYLQGAVWDTATGRAIGAYQMAHMTFSPDARHIAITNSLSSPESARNGMAYLIGLRQTRIIDTRSMEPAAVLLSPGTQCYPENIAVSDDGQYAIVAYDDYRAIVWDIQSASQKFVLNGHTDNIVAMAFSRDGKLVVTASDDRTAIVWNTEDGKKVRKFTLSATAGVLSLMFGGAATFDFESVSFSPDARHLYVRGEQAAVVWEIKTGRRTKYIAGDLATFCPDGRRFALKPTDRSTKGENSPVIREIFSDENSLTLDGSTKNLFRDGLATATFLPQNRGLLTLSGGQAALWDSGTGRRLRTYSGQDAPMLVVPSRDGERVLVVEKFQLSSVPKLKASDLAKLYLGPYAEKGRALERIAAEAQEQVMSELVVGATPMAKGSSVALRDVVTGDTLGAFQGPGGVQAAAFNQDGTKIVTVGQELVAMKTPDLEFGGYETRTSAIIWDVAAQKIDRSFIVAKEAMMENVSAAQFSPDGTQLIIGRTREKGSVSLWQVATGRRLLEFERSSSIGSAMFSPDGKSIAISAWKRETERGRTALWSVENGRLLRVFDDTKRLYSTMSFSSDGSYLLTAGTAPGGGGVAVLWDARTGAKLHEVRTTDSPTCTEFSPDGSSFLVGCFDATVHIWNTATAEKLATLVLLDRTQQMLVVSPGGLFDGTADARQRVMFRIGGGLKLVPVDRFFQDFYYPGLLSAVWNGKQPVPEYEIATTPPPRVQILSPEKGGPVGEDQVTLRVEAVDEGGGVRGPWLVQNGARVLVPSETRVEGKAKHREFTVPLVEGENRFEVRAASADGSWESEPAVITLQYDKPLPKPELHLVAVGISRYAEDGMDLDFPRDDALAISQLFRERGSALYADVHVHPLLDEQATRNALFEKVCELAGTARPQDTLIVFLAGHGMMVNKQYYFLPHEFRRRAETMDADILRDGVPAADIGRALASVPSLRRMVIFDTGQSGRQIGDAPTGRNPFAFRGAIERLSRAQGAFTLASATISPEAHEVPELKHGVLTYALLAGLHATDAGPLKDRWIEPSGRDRVAQVLEWYGFASTHVPQLSEQYFGRQQDIQHGSAGTSFPVLPVVAEGTPSSVSTPADRQAAPRSKASLSTIEQPSPTSESTVFVVAVGVSKYSLGNMDLQFGAADAEAIAKLFRDRGTAGGRQVKVVELVDEQATRANVLRTLQQISDETGPDDTLVVFLAGHGTVVGQRYYFIPHDFTRKAATVDEDIQQTALPVDALGDAITRAKAGSRLLILDTCASGGALDLRREGRVPFAFRGAIEKLNRREGMFIIAASSVGEEAQEIADLKHGVLTYALLAGLGAAPSGGPLEGLSIQPASRDGRADVLEWFSYAAGHVPRLTKRYLGREQDVQTSGQGTSFLILPVRQPE